MAKEKFENRNINGGINIKLEGRGNWVARKEDVVEAIINIVEDYADQGHKLTLRQLYYQLVVADAIPNHDTVYKKISSILDDCRYSGIIDWDAIEDRGRIPHKAYYEHSVEQAMINTVNCYSLDKQRNQPNMIEVWTEKDAISGILKGVVDDYTIRLVVNKGYISSAALYNSYIRFADAIKKGKRISILYFGDHDPSGLDMIRDIRDRLMFFFLNGSDSYDFEKLAFNWAVDNTKNYVSLTKECENYVNDDDCCEDGEGGGNFVKEKAFWKHHFQVIPIGLTMTQIKQYNPPHNPAKMTDPRAKWYTEQFGRKSWEVDALKPAVMSKIVRDAIKSRIDGKAYNEIQIQEEEDLKRLNSLLKKK